MIALFLVQFNIAASEGVYECQVSSTIPPVNHFVELKMVQTKTFIHPTSSNNNNNNNNNMHLNANNINNNNNNNNILDTSIRANLSALLVRLGEQIHLTCSIETADVTDFVYWYKNKEPIQYDQLRPLSDKLNKISKLTSNRIPTVKLHHNNYQQKQQQLKNRHHLNQTASIEPVLLTSSSSLSLGAALLNHTGNYTCAVSFTTNKQTKRANKQINKQRDKKTLVQTKSAMNSITRRMEKR